MTYLTPAPETPAPAFGTWQPIETAPKDGSVFLAFDDDEGHGISMGVVACRWMPEDEDEPEEYPANWIVTEIGGDSELHGCVLTHWMPIPPAPEMK